MLKIVLKRSYIGVPEKQRKVLRALGLKKIGATTVKQDDKAIRGMIGKVSHMLNVEKVDG